MDLQRHRISRLRGFLSPLCWKLKVAIDVLLKTDLIPYTPALVVNLIHRRNTSLLTEWPRSRAELIARSILRWRRAHLKVE
jgi:hypothetical protein